MRRRAFIAAIGGTASWVAFQRAALDERVINLVARRADARPMLTTGRRRQAVDS